MGWARRPCKSYELAVIKTMGSFNVVIRVRFPSSIGVIDSGAGVTSDGTRPPYTRFRDRADDTLYIHLSVRHRPSLLGAFIRDTR